MTGYVPMPSFLSVEKSHKKRSLFWLLTLLAALIFPVPPPLRADQLDLIFPDSGTNFGSALKTEDDPGSVSEPQSPGERPESELRAAHVVGRVLNYLFEAEAKETNPHYRADLRVAWCLTLYCHREDPEPMLLAWRAVLKCRPEEVWPNMIQNRRNRLGPEFDQWYTADGVLKPETVFGASSPKKPAQSVRNTDGRKDIA